jgi:hypothetical protein
VATSKSTNDQELVELQRALLTAPTVDVPHNEADQETVRAFMQRRAAQREAYGQFKANSDIYDPMGGTLVFTPGMPVPLEHVEMWGLEETGLVERVATPAEARKAGALAAATSGPATLLGDANVGPATNSTDKK